MGLPVAHHLRNSILHGEWPLWNPLSNCGAPFLAQWGTLASYPGSLLFAVAPLPWALNLFALGHIFLGGLGMFCLVRRWTGHSKAAALAGVAYVFNGVTLSSLIWANYTVALGWLPWVVLWTRRGWLEGGHALLAATVVAALQLLPGAPELTAMTWIVVAATFTADLRSARQLQGGVGRPRMTGRLLAIVGLTTALCAVQLLPFLDLLAQSHRVGAFRPRDWAMPAWGWANLFVPTFRSGPPSDEIPQAQLGQGFLMSYYLGLGPLFLALVAVTWARDRLIRALGALTLGCWWMAMGDNSVLHPLVGRLFPGLYTMQYPVKFALLTGFLVPLLAAHGWVVVDAWVESGWFRWRRVVGPFAAVALISGGVVWWSRQPAGGLDAWEWVWPNALARVGFLAAFALAFWAVIYHRGPGAVAGLTALCLVVVADAWTHNHTLVPLMKSSALTPGVWSDNNGGMRLLPGESRVFIPPAVEKVMATRRISGIENRVIGRHLALWSHLNLVEGIAKVNGASALPIRFQREVEREIYKFNNTNCTGMLDFLGVAAVSQPENPTAWIPRPGALGWLQVGMAPRFDRGTNVLWHVMSPEFDPRQEVWLDESLSNEVTVRGTAQGRVTSHTFKANGVTASVDLATPGLMTIAQSHSPHWRAWVNGSPVPVYRANHAFQAVMLPAGLSQVELRYVDPGFTAGLAISGATAALLGILALIGRPPVTASHAASSREHVTDPSHEPGRKAA
jgi:hypothetical protein